jgi:hypothetical protein
MTPSTIRAKIARCIQVQRLIAVLEEEEKKIKQALAVEAASDTQRQAPTDGGGWSWTHEDSDGNLARVTQPADKLKAKLDPEAKAFDKVKETAGRCFMQLFMQVPAYRPVEGFREKVAEYLPRPSASKLLKLVTTESPIQVAFEVKEGA